MAHPAILVVGLLGLAACSGALPDSEPSSASSGAHPGARETPGLTLGHTGLDRLATTTPPRTLSGIHEWRGAWACAICGECEYRTVCGDVARYREAFALEASPLDPVEPVRPQTDPRHEHDWVPISCHFDEYGNHMNCGTLSWHLLAGRVARRDEWILYADWIGRDDLPGW